MEHNQHSKGHYLKFFVGGHQLLMNVFNVHSIIERPVVVSLAQAPAYILGIVSVEGTSIPLLDTSLRLGFPASPTSTAKSKIILASPSGAEEQDQFFPIAFTTEDIDDVIRLNAEDLQPLPMDKAAYDDRLFEGVFEHDQQLMMLLNIDNFYKENFDEILKTQD